MNSYYYSWESSNKGLGKIVFTGFILYLFSSSSSFYDYYSYSYFFNHRIEIMVLSSISFLWVSRLLTYYLIIHSLSAGYLDWEFFNLIFISCIYIIITSRISFYLFIFWVFWKIFISQLYGHL